MLVNMLHLLYLFYIHKQKYKNVRFSFKVELRTIYKHWVRLAKVGCGKVKLPSEAPHRCAWWSD